MALETSSGGIWVLNKTWPEASDDLNQADNHLRTIKASIKNTFPNLSATASLSAGALNFCKGVKSDVQTQLDTLSKSLVGNVSTIDTISASLQAEITRTDALSASFSVMSVSLAAAISHADVLSTSLQAEISRTDILSASLSAEISRTDDLSDIVNVARHYGSLYVHNGTTAITATTSLGILTTWADAGAFVGITPSTVSSTLTISRTGTYQLACNFSFSGDANVTFEFHTFKNTTEDLEYGTIRKIGSGGDVGSCALVGTFSANPSDVISIRSKADAASSAYTLRYAQFLIKAI